MSNNLYEKLDEAKRATPIDTLTPRLIPDMQFQIIYTDIYDKSNTGKIRCSSKGLNTNTAILQPAYGDAISETHAIQVLQRFDDTVHPYKDIQDLKNDSRDDEVVLSDENDNEQGNDEASQI